MNREPHPSRNLAYGVTYLALVISLGVAGYHAAGWSFADALYMVVITVFSVGYEEVRPVTEPALRALTMSVIVLGSFGMVFVTGALVQLFTAVQLQQFMGYKRMKNEIGRLHDHVIICGFGRIGVMLARDLRAGQQPLVILDRREERLAEAREMGFLCIQGEATEESVLIDAGIMRARTLATVLPDDSANVFITLSARGLNKDLQIIARGEQPATESKLVRAGANKVVLPAHIGAERIAEIILYPETSRMIRGSEVMRGFERELNRLGLDLDLIAIEEGSQAAGLTIAELEGVAQGAFLVAALNRKDGSTITRPPAETRIEPGDGVVLIGRGGNVAASELMAAKRWGR
jgi:voltage-gated potassium channel Kch